MPDTIELVGVSEIAEMAGVSKQVVTNWRARSEKFPPPVAELRSGPVWSLRDIVTWSSANGVEVRVADKPSSKEPVDGRLATVVSLVNMKGGVGKSTLTANLGWYCAYKKNMKVLLVDLDPQFNLSQYTLGPQRYEEHQKSDKKSVIHIFEQFTPALVTESSNGDLRPDAVVVTVAKWHDGSRLDIIPSRLELAWTLKNPTNKEPLLRDFLAPLLSEYDLILIDCPPTESMLTGAAYLASDSVLVPVKPEFLSTIGLPLLVRSLDEFQQRNKGNKIEFLGIVFNDTSDKVEQQRSRKFVADLAAKQGWYLFKNAVTHSDSYPAGSRAGKPIFRTEYARGWKIREFEAVAEEFVARLGL